MTRLERDANSDDQHSSLFLHVNATPRPPASPRQQSQSRGRIVKDHGPLKRVQPHHPCTKQQLQHVSTFRVQPPVRHSHSASNPTPILRSNGNNIRSLPRVCKEPDFIVEERAAWNRPSPDVGEVFPAEERTRVYDGRHVGEDFVLRPSQYHDSPPQPFRQPTRALADFGPTHTTFEDHERPKTSRGPKSGMQGLGGIQTDAAGQGERKSKFLEGSMNERSISTASSWYDPTDGSEDCLVDTDSDATPRASRISRDSDNSFDLTDLKPQPPTPGTIKQRFSKLANTFWSGEESNKSVAEPKHRPKKRLRKSISSWSLHNLSDKMKFFGNSTHDIPSKDESPVKKSAERDIRVLEDRKRKADEAYAQQFGFKKQKSNCGLPQGPNATRTPEQTNTVKRRLVSAHRSITPSILTARRRTPSATSSRNIQDPADLVGDRDLGSEKRPSRRELEKENQQLRALLREQSHSRSNSLTKQPAASVSSYHLPLVQPTNHSDRTPSKKAGTHYQDIPPVPPLPSRVVLGSMGKARSSVSDMATMKRNTGGLSRPVSMIFEEDEANNENRALGSLNAEHAKPGITEQWEWPEDVF